MATEIGSAVVLLGAAAFGLIWANFPAGDSYESFWETNLSLSVGGAELSLELREWVNQGLMTLFFFGVGLELRREFDMGELRERSRIAVPVLAAIGGVAVPALLYLAFAADTDAARDHLRGPEDAAVTLVEYGDYECPFCGQAEGVIRDLLAEFRQELRYAFRHLPLTDVHEQAELAAEAAEAAAAQDAFWEMHDLLYANQARLTPGDLRRHAQQLGLDVERFWEDVRTRRHARRIAEDVNSGDLSDVVGTPTFFINGRRHFGAFDVDTLSDAVRAALRGEL